ncbi:MAG: hypothetical protein R2737_16500 [Candidatus Nanopelagicales bacterium]
MGRHRAERTPIRSAVDRVRGVVRSVLRIVTKPLDWAGHVGSVVWRSLFVTAAFLAFAAGILHALGRVGDAYSAILVAGALGAAATFFGLLALRVEPDTTTTDAETQP